MTRRRAFEFARAPADETPLDWRTIAVVQMFSMLSIAGTTALFSTAYFAARALRPGAESVATDVCVPISRLAECVDETKRDIEASGLIAPIVGHVGDGNFHMLILIDPAKPEETEGAKALQARMVARAIAMDGTCTGEHGIGLGKIDYLADELGEAVDVMRSIKSALDPNGLMNPGKIFASGAKA